MIGYIERIEAGASGQKRPMPMPHESPKKTSRRIPTKILHGADKFNSSSLMPKRWTPSSSSNAGGSILETPLNWNFIVVSRPNQDWYSNQLSKLKKLETLKSDWDSYGAEIPNKKAFYWTRQTLEIMFAKGIYFGKVVPSAEGGLAISFRKGLKYADIEFLNSGEILAINHESNKKPLVWKISEDEIDIEDSLQKIWCFLKI